MMSADRPMPLVSVLMPVYNASATLPLCLGKLFAQTYGSLEFVFVDDCSTDDSVSLIEAAAASANRADIAVKILRNQENQGVAAARNAALAAASGDYICWVDADDWMEPDAIASLVAKAGDAEIVGFDWYLTFDRNERRMSQRPFSTPLEALRNMMSGVMRWNLWLFMAKRSLYERAGICFIPGKNMGEDMLVTISLFLKAESAAFIPEAYYHYRQVNDSSVSRTFSDETMAQVTYNVDQVSRAVSSSCYADELSACMDFLKQFIKLPLLMSTDRAQYRRWNDWFAESDKSIMANTLVPLRTRLVEYAASRRWYLLLQIYHVLVYKVVYGLIYR